jgi:threonine/homoserine/homoserine lactone efflux protein
MSSSFGIFVAAALILLLTPGPSVLFIVARSIDQGTRAGLVSVAGMATGGIVHVTAAALGVSAIVLSSALAFAALKYVGAAYLVYLGVNTLRSARQPVEIARPQRQPLSRTFREAITVQIFNPKAALFFFAFLPQFVDPARGPAFLQILFLGGVYHGLALVTDSAYALAAGQLRSWLTRSTRVVKVQRNISGATYIGLGILTATAGPSK